MQSLFTQIYFMRKPLGGYQRIRCIHTDMVYSITGNKKIHKLALSMFASSNSTPWQGWALKHVLWIQKERKSKDKLALDHHW